MAREQRRNREYYYRKRRQGRKVISEYVGAGLVADIAEAKDNIRRNQEAQRRAAWQAAKDEQQRLDAMVNDFSNLATAYADALFLVNGYRQHKRFEWRKKRGKS